MNQQCGSMLDEKIKHSFTLKVKIVAWSCFLSYWYYWYSFSFIHNHRRYGDDACTCIHMKLLMFPCLVVPHEYQGGSLMWVDCDKTAAPGLGLDCCSCSLPETESLNCCRELMPWDVHCITVNVTGGALSLADVLYMLCCAGSSAVYQTWACLGSRSSPPSSTLLRRPFCLWVAWSQSYSKGRTAV